MAQSIVSQFHGMQLIVTPNKEHSFLMTTAEVAKGYGVSGSAVRQHLKRNSKELIEKEHFVRVTNCHAGNSFIIFWTKRGVIRLGMFIKSLRAVQFRNWAENLILDTVENSPVSCPGLCRFRQVLDGIWTDGKTRYITPNSVRTALYWIKNYADRLLKEDRYQKELEAFSADIPLFGGLVYDERKISEELDIDFFNMLNKNPFDHTKNEISKRCRVFAE